MRRATAIALLAAAPFLLAGGGEVHLGHASGEAEEPIFSSARHAAEGHHWEAADRGHAGRCRDCLAPGPAPVPPTDLSRQPAPSAERALRAAAASPADPGAGRLHRPRGPPSSGLS